jgi:F0F1-type ATP synthase membrane subunit b/b'
VNYDLIAYWSQIAGFVLFAATLVWSWNKFVLPAVARAQKASNERISAGERHLEEMRKAVEALEHELEGARTDAAAIVQRAKTQSEREYLRTLEEAKAAGERAVRNAEGELERSRMAARSQLREALAAKALEIARGEASRRVDDRVNATLVHEFLTSLGQTTNGQ